MMPSQSTIGPLAPGQRWSVARKREVCCACFAASFVELLSRELGVPIYKLEQWREKADGALDGALKERESDPASGELAADMQRIGELRHEGRAAARQNRASQALWPAGGRGDGRGDFPDHRPPLRRSHGSAGSWDQPRSSFYAARQPQAGAVAPASASARRGPKPIIGDEALLAAIRADLKRSPWTGEGHRKVWARLRAIDGVRVSRKRLLRLMREYALTVAPSRSHAL